LDWMLDPFSADDKKRFLSLKTPANGGHLRTIYKPFDTSIMELADDIAYGVHDLEDALALGLVDRNAWMEQVSALIQSMPDNPIKNDLDTCNALRFVGYFIQNIYLEELSEFSHPMLSLQVRMKETAYEMLLLIKSFVMQHVILRPELQMLQYKGQQVMVKLFEIFEANPKRLLPHEVYAGFEQEGYRAIADYLSNMTDVSAGKLYHKLLSPTSGSIFDRT